MGDDRYVQQLPALALAIERATDRTPDMTRYHVFQGEKLVDSFRRLPDAQQRFRELRDESGWQPEQSEDDPDELLRREREARERYRQAEHWHRASTRRGWFKGQRW